ncbi:MAG: PTS ascorbate transporter subunit IIB, partial [Clostridium baratii]|nr:PTS ascorbate transporter subunit IIB [Clostridium baratii]
KTQASGYDVVFCSEALKKNFAKAESSGTIIIGLKNLLSEKEIEEKIVENVVNK